MAKEPETPEAKKAREAAQKEADRLAKVREGKLKERLDLISARNQAQKDHDEITNRYKGKVAQHTNPEEIRLNALKDSIKKLNARITVLNKELDG
jgi:hypothetical protein